MCHGTFRGWQNVYIAHVWADACQMASTAETWAFLVFSFSCTFADVHARSLHEFDVYCDVISKDLEVLCGCIFTNLCVCKTTGVATNPALITNCSQNQHSNKIFALATFSSLGWIIGLDVLIS